MRAVLILVLLAVPLVLAAPVPKHKAFHRAFCRLQPQTVRAINESLVRWSVAQVLEDGKKLRSDTTVVETNIHHPTDSTLLADGARVLTRSLQRIAEECEAGALQVVDHARAVKRRVLEIHRSW